MGDFNYRDVNWNTSDATAPNSKRIVDCLEDNFLTQHVRKATRNDSVLDLVITGEPDIIQEIDMLGRFAKNEHNLLKWSMDIMVNCKQKEQAKIDVKKANFEAIKSELNASDWDLELHGGAIDSWKYFKNKLDKLMTKAGQKKKVLWLSNKAVKLVNRKHKIR